VISIFNGRKRTLGGQTSDVHIQVSVDFRQHLALLKGAPLAVFLAISLHSNEDGWAWPSRNLIARETGYNITTISKALSHLCRTTLLGQRLLLRYQPQAEDGSFKPNRYLIFPSPKEVDGYERQPCIGFPYTAEPCTAGPYTGNLYTNHNHDEEEQKRKRETAPTTTIEPPNKADKQPVVVVDIDSNSLSILSQLGIMEPTCSQIITLPHINQHYLQEWLDWYEGQDEVGPGAVINNLRAGSPAPIVKQDNTLDNHRYLQFEGIQH
jgi:hypothetical protein